MGFLKGFFVEEVPQQEDYDFGEVIEDVDVKEQNLMQFVQTP